MVIPLFLAVSAFFSIDGTMEQNGWTMGRSQAADDFSVRSGVLTCSCSSNPMKGVSYHRNVDFPKSGEMSYEVRLFVSGHTDRYVLQICLGELMMSFCGQSALRYYYVPTNKCPNWKVVGKDRIPGNIWTKVRLRWNTDKRTIKYYVGEDQMVPSYVESDVVIAKARNGDGLYRLSIGNYGLHGDHEVHQIRNLEIKSVEDDAAGGNVVRDTAVVFRGLNSDFFPIQEWVKGFPDQKVVNFTLEFNGMNCTASNKLSLSGCPDDDLCARAKLIVLCDMPLDKNVLPYQAQEDILHAVNDGARMIVTGGLVGLEKCGDYQAPIPKALPVRLSSPWSLPDSREKVLCSYGKGKIVVLNMRKAR